MEQNSTMMKGWAVENKTSSLLHEIFATLKFRDLQKFWIEGHFNYVFLRKAQLIWLFI